MFKGLFDGYLKFLGIFTLVKFAWILLEIIMLGEIIPNNVDSVVAVILSFSLYNNLESTKDKED